MTIFMLFIMWMLSIMFIFLNHPLSLGLILLIQTIMTSLITGMLTMNFWYSYILFLIMIGGMLILFIYMTSVAANEKFKFSKNLLIFTLISNMMMFMFMFIDQFFLKTSFNSLEMNSQNLFNNFNMMIIKYLNYPNNLMFTMMIIYLFLVLIMVVKIITINKGPLRQKF
uniref:NADH-ubiquinone oxidoreductase chain 6 n=1 Tax=Erotylinae sp. 4 ACP-2013 TaxID=1434615 RepID=A0A3G3FYG4_9CUCU|nr:NADH dehydrogenase subunit 6 [Erotylinae sp. 4 ACP-2013]